MQTNNNKRPRPIIAKDNFLRSFGRVYGRKLSTYQKDLVENFLPQISIDVESFENLCDLFKEQKDEYWLEIGFGNGGHLAQQAEKNENIGYIGSELFTNGVANLLKEVKEKELKNIKVFYGDARILLDKLPDSSLNGVYILYPDPWPKAKHNKKRIISHDLLKVLGRIVKKDGKLIIASDHDDYKVWIKEHLDAAEYFVEDYISTEDPKDWIKTKYQMKAEKIGQGSMFFCYLRK